LTIELRASQFVACAVVSPHVQLNVFNNRLLRIPASVGELTGLDDVNVSANRLKTLPPVPGWGRMSRLSVSANTIVLLPPLSSMAPSLGQLLLGDNGLTAFPDLGAARQLQILDVSKNSIPALPNRLGALIALTTLQLRFNALRALPDVFGTLLALESLDLERNNVEGLPSSLGSCINLRTLIASGNRIRTLPPTLVSCGRLERVALDRNPLDISHSGTLRVLRHLRTKCGEAEGGALVLDARLDLRPADDN
jgi:Leucine-rich repeat (LRR) protein